MNIHVNRPEPIELKVEPLSFIGQMDPKIAIKELLNRNYILIEDFYSSGLTLLNELKIYIKNKHSKSSFQGQRDFRELYHELSNRILLKISNNILIVKKAPEVGWLKILYPDISDFILSFPKIQGLNSSWQWYKKGVFVPVLGEKIYPYFGNYFPTRFEHLELFEDWLVKYKGTKRSAFDIGIGSGILSFQLLQHGFEKVIGTDVNPNSIIGLKESISKNTKYSNLDLIYGNLFANSDSLTELIVFNPPWLPAERKIGGLDAAIYYNSSLFSDFFEKAKRRLKPDGKLVLLFSNLAQITNVCKFNPIEQEVDRGGRFKKELLVKKKVKSASSKTKRSQNWRPSESVELWVLVHQWKNKLHDN